MNTTKKWLIIVAIIFNILEVGYEIYTIVNWFLLPEEARYAVFYLAFDFITIACCVTVAVLLSMAIWKNGKFFRQRYGYYMTAIVISIIIHLLSVSSVLLIITMFLSDWVWIKPDKDDTVTIDKNTQVIRGSKEEKIAHLRKLKEEGKITEEEFQDELLKLL